MVASAFNAAQAADELVVLGFRQCFASLQLHSQGRLGARHHLVVHEDRRRFLRRTPIRFGRRTG